MVDGLKITKETFRTLSQEEKTDALFDKVVDISEKIRHQKFVDKAQVLGMGFLGGFSAMAAKLIFWR